MKRKYTVIGEERSKDECTNRKCKWQGKDPDKIGVKTKDGWSELTCPKCGNNEFYGLL